MSPARCGCHRDIYNGGEIPTDGGRVILSPSGLTQLEKDQGVILSKSRAETVRNSPVIIRGIL